MRTRKKSKKIEKNEKKYITHEKNRKIKKNKFLRKK